MAPSRGKGKARAVHTPNGVSRRSTRQANDDVPDVYQDLLAEADATGSTDWESDRPLKKRRVAASRYATAQTAANVARTAPNRAPANQQGVEDSGLSDDDDSKTDFEDVDLEHNLPPESTKGDDGVADLSVTINDSTALKRTTPTKRKPASAAEKAFRLMVHKAHILCLLGHCMYINTWCNNDEVQHNLRTRLSKKTISYLNPKSDDSQFQKDRSFMDGLQQASDTFRGNFMITDSGMWRAKWNEGADEDAQPVESMPIDRAGFIQAAKEFKGSQDAANQLHCALLRSVGVEARLVCSLQPLSFTTGLAASSTPQKIAKHTVFAQPLITNLETNGHGTEDVAMQESSTVGKVPSARRRLGQPSFAHASMPSPTPKKKAVRKLAYPVFWVEAFNNAQQRWIAVDPIVTQTVGKPSKLQPPDSYEANQMLYAIAFESDGVARDVTRRYARAYNAKTRRHRVESTENGTQWLKKAMRIFRRRDGILDREQVEDAELAQKEAKEGLPKNVQDFKSHPYYALERHLKRHEVIHPKREVGKVNAGTAAKPRMEIVYRRQDVCVCRSADKWFRLGRRIKEGEIPVKRVPARRRHRQSKENAEDFEGEQETVPVYAGFQTELYVPPPVLKGKVPRNAFGNLDIYVPSMVPAGGVHIRHDLAQQAAKILMIDFADAVTGFQFKGRQGSAVIDGAIVAREYASAVMDVIEGLQDERTEDESMARSAIALRMWRRFLTGLRIAERVSGYGDPEQHGEAEEEAEMTDEEQVSVADGGGFFPDEADEELALPTAGKFTLNDLATAAKSSKRTKRKPTREDSEDEADSTTDGNDEGGFDRSETRSRAQRRVLDDDSEDEHMTDAVSNAEYGSGGFMPEAEESGDDNIAGEDGPSGGDYEMEDFGHEDGGGFLVEEQAPDEADQNESLLRSPEEQPELNSTAREVMSLKRPAETEDQTAVPARAVDLDGAVSEANGAMPCDRDLHTAAETTKIAPDHVDSEHDEDSQRHQILINDGMAHSDHGSMLSHDPEDEDAEPDWLDSD